MAEEKSVILPRKVTKEDKEAALADLMPHFGKEYFAEMKASFGKDRGLKPTQVDSIILELRRKAFLSTSLEE